MRRQPRRRVRSRPSEVSRPSRDSRLFDFGSARRAHTRACAAVQELRAELRVDRRGDLRMFLEIEAGVVLALPDPLAVVAVPGAGFLDEVVIDAELDQLALARGAFAVEDLELRLPERRRDLVLDDF